MYLSFRQHFRINHDEKFAEEKIILTVLRIFGIKPKDICVNLTEYNKEHFHLFIKKCQFRFNNKDIEKQLEIIYNLAKKGAFFIYLGQPQKFLLKTKKLGIIKNEYK